MYDVIVIGGGVAGSSAAIFCAKNKYKTLLIDKGADHSVSGHLASINDFPGIEQGTTGAALLAKLHKQAGDLGADVKHASVTSCIFGDGAKRVITNEPVTYESKVVILASGNMPHQDANTYAGEKELHGKGVSHNAEADAPSCKHSAVAIVGKSTATAETALLLAKHAEKVYWVIPASKLDLLQGLKDELEKATRIEPFFSSSLKKINGTDSVSSVSILTAGQEKTLNVKYVFLPFLPHKPVTDFLNGTGVQVGPEGVVMVDQRFETNIKGVFAVGNILCSKPQLHIVCSAQGAIAAINVEDSLKG